jgi:hypothetical protein
MSHDASVHRVRRRAGFGNTGARGKRKLLLSAQVQAMVSSSG